MSMCISVWVRGTWMGLINSVYEVLLHLAAGYTLPWVPSVWKRYAVLRICHSLSSSAKEEKTETKEMGHLHSETLPTWGSEPLGGSQSSSLSALSRWPGERQSSDRKEGRTEIRLPPDTHSGCCGRTQSFSETGWKQQTWNLWTMVWLPGNKRNSEGIISKALQNQSVTEDHRAALETKSQTYLQTAFFPAPLEF